MSDLSDGDDVHRVVHLPVAAQRETMDAATAGLERDRCGPAVGGETVTAREPGDVAGVADDHGSDYRPDPEDVGQ